MSRVALRRRRRPASRVLLASVALLPLLPSAASAATANISPRTLSLPIGGLLLPVPVSGDVRYTMRGGRAEMDGRIAADLAAAQRQAPSILAALLDRKQPCGDRLAVRDGRFGIRDSALSVTASLDYGRSACVAGQAMTILPRSLYDVEMLLHPVVGPRSLRMRAEVLTLRRRGAGELPAQIAAPLRQMLGALVGERIGELFPGAVPADLTLRSLAFEEPQPGRLAVNLRAAGSVPQATFEQLINRR
jgi:hypothetical protein